MKVVILGSNGFLGSNLTNFLNEDFEVVGLNRENLDLDDEQEIKKVLMGINPDYVLLAAGKVGGIGANLNNNFLFFDSNLAIQRNVFNTCLNLDIKNIIFFASNTIYPNNIEAPFREGDLDLNNIDSSNYGYSLSKIVGIKAAEILNLEKDMNITTLVLSNLYGPNDNFNKDLGHVIPSLIAKFVSAKELGSPEVNLWGTGKPKREVTYVKDICDAVRFSIKNKVPKGVYNVGSGDEYTIEQIANLIKEISLYKGETIFDSSKPDGTMRKIMDSSKFNNLGWASKTKFDEGLLETINYYRKITSL